MTARASGEVVGTAQAAELADVLYAYLTPAAGGSVLGQLVSSAQATAAPSSLGCAPGPLCGYGELAACLLPPGLPSTACLQRITSLPHSAPRPLAFSLLTCPPPPCPPADGKLYANTCAAKAAGTSIRCFNCASGSPAKCPAATNGSRPNGLPGNLSWHGEGYVRTPGPGSGGGGSPPSRGPASNLGAMKARPPPPSKVRRPQRN
jgi:hypothetical protein